MTGVQALSKEGRTPGAVAGEAPSQPKGQGGAEEPRGLTWREDMKTPKIRNPVAYALALRGKGKALKHRSTPRGGATNDTMELLRQAAEEEFHEEEPEEDK